METAHAHANNAYNKQALDNLVKPFLTPDAAKGESKAPKPWTHAPCQTTFDCGYSSLLAEAHRNTCRATEHRNMSRDDAEVLAHRYSKQNAKWTQIPRNHRIRASRLGIRGQPLLARCFPPNEDVKNDGDDMILDEDEQDQPKLTRFTSDARGACRIRGYVNTLQQFRHTNSLSLFLSLALFSISSLSISRWFSWSHVNMHSDSGSTRSTNLGPAPSVLSTFGTKMTKPANSTRSASVKESIQTTRTPLRKTTRAGGQKRETGTSKGRRWSATALWKVIHLVPTNATSCNTESFQNRNKH